MNDPVLAIAAAAVVIAAAIIGGIVNAVRKP